MKKLKEFITEAKNTHMTHVEDLVFDEGVEGARKAIIFLGDLRNMLAGHGKSKVTATVKWDGAPAIFVGVDPRDGKFFVAKKGVFNKTPMVYKTAKEIDADTSGDLAAKLKVALTEFKKLGIKSGVYQGDLMFTNDKKIEVIDGVRYITFHPNTIVYAVPATGDLGSKIARAKIGVVWHTKYEGSSFETMRAVFGKSIVSTFNNVPTVWQDDATYQDYTGTATFTESETTAVTSLLSQAGSLFRTIPAATLNDLANNEELNKAVNTYQNSMIRAGKTITNTRQHVIGLFDFIHEKYQKEIDKRKTQRGKDAQEEKRKAVLKWFANHSQQDIIKIFDLVVILGKAKQMIVDKMNEAGHISTFIRTANGFRVTGVEGFVAIDHVGNAVKIVDRMEFSRSNFSPDVIKGWQR
jgi:hypothetical protein